MVLKLIDKVKFLLSHFKLRHGVYPDHHHRNTGGEPVCVWNFIYMGGGAGRHGHGLHYIFRRSMATINNSNTRIDFFIRKLPGPVYRGFEILDDCICIAFLLVICRYAAKLVGTNLNALSAAMKIPLSVNYVGVLSGCVLMIIFYVLRLWIDVEKLRGRNMDYVEEELSR